VAIDTRRQRLEALDRRARANRVPASFGRPRRDARRRGIGRSGARGLGEPLWLALCFAGALDCVEGVALPGCDALATHYDRAARGLGGSFAASAESAFERARRGCDRELATYASSSRAQACDTASRQFARALDRRRAIAATIRPGAVAGTIGVSAAGIVTGEDGSREETLARSVFAECAG
jgi:hypothetical protein